MTVPRSEYPRPQFVRPDWLCLNGEWQFEIDCADSGADRGLCERELNGWIMVPFCPESELSGIGTVDFMAAVWYRRTVTIPSEWAGQRVLLHFQAVDYDATVWVNGQEVGRHRGGFTPFECDLHGVASAGETVTIVVRARDPKHGGQPRGKQSVDFANRVCHYTRTTGIWQTVWLEPVPHTRLQRPRITPDLATSQFWLEQPIFGPRKGLHFRATLRDTEGIVTTAECDAESDFSPRLALPIPTDRRRLWSLHDPYLYDLDLELIGPDGVVDHLASYAGLRSVTIDGLAVKINGATVFQRLVLDQGYYPDGIMTAPTDAALRKDIELSLAAGFNGARLHQKVFEERFLYHADRLGYLCWGEFPDWGLDLPGAPHQRCGTTVVAQWAEALARDYSHPSIIGWCPLNETWEAVKDHETELGDATRALFLLTKAMDTTRPVLDTSGYSHRVLETDLYDSHDYIRNDDFWNGFETFQKRHARTAEGEVYVNLNEANAPISTPYRGQPYFVSEFGGIWWNPRLKAVRDPETVGTTDDSWGYGTAPEDAREMLKRFAALCETLLANPGMFGYCYTQLTDVFQEQNGLFYFDREAKFDLSRLCAIQQQPAAIETVG